MRQVHLVHIIALLALFCATIYWLGAIEQAERFSAPALENGDWWPSSEEQQAMKTIFVTRLAAFAGVVVFGFSMVVGFKVRPKRKILGTVWALLGLGFTTWNGLMWVRPSHITLAEVLPFCVLYVIIGVVASAYCIATWTTSVSLFTRKYDEELLDN